MDLNSFWSAFGAIGGTVGALATTAAVIVALWQTKYSYKKKLKLSFTDNITITPMSGDESVFYHYIGVTVTNIGNRDVVIQNWGFDLDDGTKMIIVPDISPFGRSIQVQLPHRLQIEEGISLYYEKTFFRNALEDSITKGKLRKNKKIQFFVTDSTYKKHYVKSNKSAQNLLSDLIEQEKTQSKQNK